MSVFLSFFNLNLVALFLLRTYYVLIFWQSYGLTLNRQNSNKGRYFEKLRQLLAVVISALAPFLDPRILSPKSAE